MIFGLDQPGSSEAHFAPMERLPSTYGERVDAAEEQAFILNTERSAMLTETEIHEELARAVGDGFVVPRDLERRIGRPFALRTLQADLLAAAAAKTDGERDSFFAFPLTPEGIAGEVRRRLQTELGEAEEVAAYTPEGAWPIAQLQGALQQGVVDAAVDPLNIATVPLGFGAGGIARVMATEGLIGVGTEALTMPEQFRQAERLETEDPNVAAQLALAGGLGAIFAGVVDGVPRALSFGRNVTATAFDRYQAYRGITETPDASSVPDDVTTIEHEKLTAAAQDAMFRRSDGAPLGPDDFPVRADDGGYQGITIQYAMGPNRPNRPNPPVMDVISRAVEDVLGPGATVRVTSGQEGPSRPMFGSNRHSTGDAADISILRGDGTPVLAGDPEMAEIARAAARHGALGIGFGTDYMGGRSIHIDLVPPGEGQAHTWGNIGTDMRDEIVGIINGREPSPVQFADFDFSPTGNASPTANPVGYVIGRLLEQGVDEQTAIALVANSMVESGPRLLADAVGDGGNAFGFVQWNGDRRIAYLAFARGRSEDPANLDTQVAFLIHELRTTERAAWDAIRGARNIQEAASLASLRFFRPRTANIDRRIGYARELWRQYQNGTVPRWQGATPTAGDDVPDFSTTSRGFTREGQVRYGTDQRIDVEYQVVDLSLLRQAEGALQPRDRSHVRSDAWVAETARDLDPALLMPSPTADRGAPIVGPDDMIESGNGRVQAIARAYERFPDRAQAYRSEIERLGYTIPPEAKRPVLVARRRSEFSDTDRQDFVVKAQDSGVAFMSATERARVGRRALTADTLALFDPAAKMTAPQNREFARRFTAAWPPSQQGQFIGQDKGLSTDGVRQIRDALFARAYEADDILRRYIEEDPGELKTLLDALAIAAPDLAQLRARIDAGEVAAEMDITPFIIDAARMIMAARDLASREGKKASALLEEMLAEVDLIEGAISPLTAALVRKFMPEGRQASAEAIGAFLSRYAREAMQAGRTGGMFDEAVGPIDVLRSIDPLTFSTVNEVGAPRGQAARPAPAQINDAVIDAYDEGASAPAVSEVDDAMFNDLFDETVPQQTADAPPAQDLAATIAAITADGPRQFIDARGLPDVDRDQLFAELKAQQPFTELDGLMAAARANHDELNRVAEAAATDLGLAFRPAPLKTADRVMQKVTQKYDGDFTYIADVARTGISVKTIEDAEAFVTALRQRFHLVDEGWQVTPAGYFDRKILVRFDDGQLGEVQIWPPGMLEAKKDGGGHKLYEIARDTLRPEAERAQAVEDMIALYGGVRDQLDGDWAANVGFGAPNRVNAAASSPAVTSGDLSSRMISSAVSREGLDQAPLRGNQMDPSPSLDTAPSMEPSTRYNFMGDTSTQQIGLDNGGVNQTPAATRKLRDGVAGIEMELPDGTRISAAELIDDLDQDDILDAVIDACALRGAA